jgi:hypothetical protein
VPAWDGIYFYSDYCSEEVYALHWDGQNVTELGEVWQSEGDDHPLGGGHNAYGDVFVTTAVFQTFGLPFTDGRVYRIVPAG